MEEGVFNAISALSDRACDYLGRYTVAFFALQSDKLVKFGSGVLLQVAQVNFVVTAAHVVNNGIPYAIQEDFAGVPIFLGSSPESRTGVLLSDVGVHCLPDPSDLALIELSAEITSTLNLHKRFLNLGYCDIREELDEDDVYAVIGYPNDDTKIVVEEKLVESKLHGYFTSPYQGGRGMIPSHLFDKDFHFAFDHRPGGYRNYDGDHTGFPKPEGASGCGIWKMNISGVNLENWSPDRAKLIAIDQSINSRTQVVIGTQISHMIAFLRKQRPDLRKAIDLSFPFR